MTTQQTQTNITDFALHRIYGDEYRHLFFDTRINRIQDTFAFAKSRVEDKRIQVIFDTGESFFIKNDSIKMVRYILQKHTVKPSKNVRLIEVHIAFLCEHRRMSPDKTLVNHVINHYKNL